MYIAQTQDTAQYRFPFSFIKYCLLFTTVPLDPSPRRENKKKNQGILFKKGGHIPCGETCQKMKVRVSFDTINI